jgi:predicted GNAT superfamily acetyltransferase
VVAAHSNQLAHGKGRGMKAPDYMVAALCFTCHSSVDQGREMSREERREMWNEAWRKTIAALFERGVLKA